ncbi:MAG: ABC transporter ATP-binding protein [Lachnospiraceae bacterium]|nr:ABC transporter ATP-binding protein [Lachnospiraceae bacterium]
MEQFKFLWKYIKRHGVQYILGIAVLFGVDYLNLFIPQLTGMVTDGLTSRTMDMAGIMDCVWKILGIGALLALGRFGWRFFLFGAARHIQYEIRNDMFKRLEDMSVEYFNENKTGDLMSRFLNDLNSVRMAIGPAVISAFDASVMAVLVIGQMMIYVDVKLTLLAIIPLSVILVGTFFYDKAMRKRYRESQEALSDLTEKVQESISGVRVIKAFVRERAEMKSFAKSSANAMDKNLSVVKLQAVVMPLLEVIIGASSLLTLLYGGYLALTGEITLGRFVAFNQYIGMLVWPMIAAGDAANMISQGMASAKRVQEVIEAKKDIFDREDVQDVDKVNGEIEFKNLTFTHKGQSEPTLRDINLNVPAGTTLALIGRTGNGKSTLANLLLHLYNTEDGMIFVDGKDINSIPLKTLRENIAYVPQDNFLFSDSLKNNISFGVVDGTMEEVVEATKAACIHDNIMEFPEEYETVVGERGVTLSGGQKQRSSIARALMKDAPILILDDSLSAVDTDTEEQILRNLKENRKGKTTIIIAHRISTIQGADIIMVLEDGEAAEIGNHQSLMELDGIYKSMYDKQQLEAQQSGKEERD